MFINISCHFAICSKRDKRLASVAKIQYNIYILQANGAFFVILHIFIIKKTIITKSPIIAFCHRTDGILRKETYKTLRSRRYLALAVKNIKASFMFLPVAKFSYARCV